jgi:hypothetical protein
VFFRVAEHFFDPNSEAVAAQGHFKIRQIGGEALGFIFADLPVDQQVGRIDVAGSQVARKIVIKFKHPLKQMFIA